MRIKIVIILVSSLLLILLALVKTNFYEPSTSIRWRQLTWNDFKGVPVLFTGWGARISSNIFTEYDSVNNQYHAYSSMNNHKSWKKLSFEGSDYTLNHEQYHFNLTESFARLLNIRIDEDSLSKEEISEQLSLLRKKVSKLQRQYDRESDHGLNEGMQRYWEFKIDSMMIVYSGNTGVVTDYLSEASLFFPRELTINSSYSDGYSYRVFGNVNIYNMSIAVFSRNSYQSPNSLRTDFERIYREDSLSIISHHEDTTEQYRFEVMFEAINKDSTKLYTDRWVKKFGFLHLIRILHPIRNNMEGYKRIKNSVMNSFKLVDSNEYWISKLDSSDGFYIEEVTNEGATQEEYTNMNCWVYNSESGVDYGIFSRIIEIENGYILPYDPVKVQDSLIYDVMLIANNEIQVFEEPDSFEEFFFIPKVEGNQLDLRIGYTVKEDTSQVCFQFYNNNIGFYLD